MRHQLSERQIELLGRWLGDWTVIEDLSWPLQDTTVLRVRSGSRPHDLIVKASEVSHHIAREVRAHRTELSGLGDRTPRMLHGSIRAGILLTAFLPGVLVEGTPAESDPDVYRQAGRMLARMHRSRGESPDYVGDLKRRTCALLDRAVDLLSVADRAELRRLALVVDERPVPLVVTHGDYQPRNWVVHDGSVAVIDFGRLLTRHWTSDIVRLTHQQFASDPRLRTAFFEGLERVPADDDASLFFLENANQAVGTVVWAHGIGDAEFESQGRRMVSRVLAERRSGR